MGRFNDNSLGNIPNNTATPKATYMLSIYELITTVKRNLDNIADITKQNYFQYKPSINEKLSGLASDIQY